MTEQLSLGPLQVASNTVEELNIIFREIQDRIDSLKGLRGDFTVHSVVTQSAKYTDTNGTVLHGFGNV